MSKEDKTSHSPFKVFLSYSRNDKSVAQKIASTLGAKDILVWLDTQELQLGDSLVSKVKEGISASDYIIVLLSENSVKSSWVAHELGHNLIDWENRDITLLPIRVDNCEVPAALASYQFIDFREDFESGVKKLADVIRLLPEVNFGKLDPVRFEALILDLLWKTGFENIQASYGKDTDTPDLIAEYKTPNPFGFEESNKYFIHCNYYRQSRADLKSINYFVSSAKNSPKDYKIILVTNSRLTSAATEWLKSVNKEHKVSVRVISGTELKRLLLRYLDLVVKYFSAPKGDEK